MAVSFTKTLQLSTQTVVPNLHNLERLATVLERIDRAMRSIRGQAQTMPRSAAGGGVGGRPAGWVGSMGLEGRSGILGMMGQFATGGFAGVMRGMVERGSAAAAAGEGGMLAGIAPYVAIAMAVKKTFDTVVGVISTAMRWFMRVAATVYIVYRALQMLTGIFDRLGQAIIRGVVLPAGKAVASLVQLGGVLQRQQAALATVFGASAGTAQLEWLTQIAYKLPQTLEDTSQAMIKLGAMGVDKMTDVRRAFMAASDMATIFGTDVERAATAIAKVGAGQMSSLTRTYGIRARDIEEYGGHLRKGTEQLDSSTWRNRQDNMNALLGFIEKNYGGAAERMAGGLQNVISNLQDFWTQLAMAVKAFGGVDAVSGAIKTFIEALTSGTNIKDWGQSIGEAIKALAPAAGTLMQYVVPLANQVVGMIATIAPAINTFVQQYAPAMMRVLTGIIAMAPSVVTAYTQLIGAVLDKAPVLAAGLGHLATAIGAVIDGLLKMAPAIMVAIMVLLTPLEKLAWLLAPLAGMKRSEFEGAYSGAMSGFYDVAQSMKQWGQSNPGAAWAESVNAAINTGLQAYTAGVTPQGDAAGYQAKILGHTYDALGRLVGSQDEQTDAQEEGNAALETQTGYLASMDQALSGINTYYRMQGAFEGGAWAKNRLLLFGGEGAVPFSRGGMVTHSLQWQLASRQLEGSFVFGATLLYQAITNGIRDAAKSSQVNWVPYMAQGMYG